MASPPTMRSGSLDRLQAVGLGQDLEQGPFQVYQAFRFQYARLPVSMLKNKAASQSVNPIDMWHIHYLLKMFDE